MTRFDLGQIFVDVPPGWALIEADEEPCTLAREEDGQGALQFSVALYEAGRKPDPTPEDLLELAKELGAKHGLGEAFDIEQKDERLRSAGASFRTDHDFTRIWYVSDGWNIVLVTYSSEWGDQHEELADCETIVSSIEFPPVTKHRAHS